jgi:hypothetical protein
MRQCVCMDLAVHSSRLVIRALWEDGPSGGDYDGIWTTEGKSRDVSNIKNRYSIHKLFKAEILYLTVYDDDEEEEEEEEGEDDDDMM